MRTSKWPAAILLWLTPCLFGAVEWERHFQQGQALEREGHYQAAAQEFEAALALAGQAESSSGELPLTLHNLGVVYRELGRYFEAERCYLRAIAIFEGQQPGRSLELAASLENLGALNLVLGRPSRAEPLYRRAYETRRDALGPTHAKVGASLHGLAQVSHQMHRYEAAEDLYRQAAAVLEGALGQDALAVADVLHNWALLYRDTRRDPEARPLLERAAASYGRAYPNHPKLAIILRNLAELEASAGNVARAGQLFERSLSICDASLPPDHPQTGIILQAYGNFLYRAKRKKEARVVAQRAHAILTKAPRDNGSADTVDVSTFTRK
jgi:tetratricopeptide (TPR) repeat protein